MLPLPTTPGSAAQLYSLTDINTNADVGGIVTAEGTGQIVINFPNLPDVISLGRETEWRTNVAPIMPDGFHIYDHTVPLSIPLSFKIHAFDDYAINGPETILQIAAKLHALALPIITGSAEATRYTSSATLANGTGISQEAASQPEESYGVGRQDFFFPPACVLNLMVGSGARDGLGIVCVGYIKSVNVDLKGPWLSSRDATVNRNLPTYGEFAFTFVHSPSYANSIPVGATNRYQLVQAGASEVSKRFYNTIAMSGGQAFGNLQGEIGGQQIINTGT